MVDVAEPEAGPEHEGEGEADEDWERQAELDDQEAWESVPDDERPLRPDPEPCPRGRLG
jgi:hypothetical protein